MWLFSIDTIKSLKMLFFNMMDVRFLLVLVLLIGLVLGGFFGYVYSTQENPAVRICRDSDKPWGTVNIEYCDLPQGCPDGSRFSDIVVSCS